MFGAGGSGVARRGFSVSRDELARLEREANRTLDVRAEERFVRALDALGAHSDVVSRVQALRARRVELTPALRQLESRAVAHAGAAAPAAASVVQPAALQLNAPFPLRVKVESEGLLRKLFGQLVATLVPLTLLYYFLFKPMMGQGGSGGGPLGINAEPKKAAETGVTFDDVQGIDEVRAEVVEVVDYLKDPAKFERMGARMPKGVLLSGPPGTGKTLLARAIAGEAGVPFFYCSGSEFDEVFVGVGSMRVRKLFEKAKAEAPSIVFIDEIDSVGSSRKQLLKTRDNTINQLLTEMDGFEKDTRVVVIAATNFVESLDAALVRPGRFDKVVTVPLPDMIGRLHILELHARNIPLENREYLRTLARGTPGFSGADLENLLNRAAIKASAAGATQVSNKHLDTAKDDVLMGVERRSQVIPEDNRKLTAYHEGGHALVALYSPGTAPIHKATIIPRGQALGMVMQLPERDEYSVSRQQLMSRLSVCMGGRVAEEMIFGKEMITTGASSDLQQATNLAREMVFRWGMSKAGKTWVDPLKEGEMSAEKKAELEKEVSDLLEERYRDARKILEEHKEELHHIAKALLEYETLNLDQIRQVIAGKQIQIE